jgi:hypothetical protein
VKLLKMLTTALFVVALLAMPYAVQAQTTSAQRYQLISSHCQQLHSLIDQLQRRDLVSRTNLGREYESIDNQLSALNTRIHNNNLDNQQFVDLLGQFNDAVTQFRDAYVHYDDGMNSLENINCQKDPVNFDAQLDQTRQLRDATGGAAERALAITSQYRDLTAQLQTTLPSSKKPTGATR